MPGPSRFFESNAERQRAYRNRKRSADQEEQQEAQDTTTYAYLVHRAVWTARKTGDALAAQVYREDAWETLRAVADHFYDRAGTPAAERPWRQRTP
jgi:hypothetical protein